MQYTKKIIATLFLLAAIATIAQSQARKAVADKIVAVVGDRIILQSEIRNSIDDARRQNPDAQIPADAECVLMEQALISKVMMLQAQKDSLPVTDEDVEANLDNRMRNFINMYGSTQALEDIAGKTVYQIKDDGRESVKEQMLAAKMQEKIVSNIKITPTEVKAFFDKIPKDSLPFFESELEIGQIIIYPKASKDLEQYIVAEMNNYKRQIETKVATFEQLAQRYSQDPGSKDRGGQYQLNRNEKTWDPIFLNTAFRLKEGEISAPVKGKSGYHLIQMVQRTGDDAIVRHILRMPPVTDAEVNIAKARLDTVRAKLITGAMSFNEAAKRYSDEDVQKNNGAFILNRDGSFYVTIDQLDKEMVASLGNLKVGDFSQPVAFTGDQNKKGVRIIYLKSRSEPHRMNLRDDYSKLTQLTLEEKKGLVIDKWLKTKIPTYYIMVDNETEAECPKMQKYVSTDTKGF